MAATIQSTDLIVASGTAFTMAATGDSFWLTAGTILASRSGSGLNTAGTAKVYIDGSVFGTSAAIVINNNDILMIGTTGSVSSASGLGSAAVSMIATTAAMINHGTISGDGIGVLSRGGVSIENTGRIFGRSNGVFMGLFNNANDVLVNSGSISAGQRVTNDFSDGRYFHAVHTEGNTSRVVNHGLISATDTQGAGVHFGASSYGGAGSVLENYGTISSVRFWGVDLVDLPTGSASVLNYGTISGGAGGYRGSNAGDVLTNRGTIQGDVLLGLGADSYIGIDGVTVGTVFGGDGTDILTGGSASDTLNGGAQEDTLRGGSGEDFLFGDADNDIIYGGNDDDTLDGGEGNDQLNGNAGDDVLLGGSGNDRLSGAAGDDRLGSGTGVDVLTGGAGADVFVFGSAAHIGNASGTRDRITDFQTGIDHIDLSAIRNGMTFIGASAFSNVPGQVRYASGLLQGDVNGDSAADFTLIIVTGSVVATDLILF